MDIVETLITSYTNSIYTCLPCLVESVRGDNQGFVDVTPQAKIQDISFPRINNIPLLQMGNRDIHISVNIKQGDTILVLFASHDITNFLMGNDTTANTSEGHQLTNSLALPFLIPTKNKPFTIPDKIVIKGDGEWTGDIEIIGNVKIDGDLKVSGKLEVSDIIKCDKEVFAKDFIKI